MQVSIETTSGLERRLTITIPADKVDGEVVSRLQKSAGNIRLDGFRPGKVPMKVLQQRFGQGVRQEVLQEVINQSFVDAVSQEDLKPAGAPQIEPKNIDSGADVKFVAVFEVFPEIEIRDYSSIEIEKPVAEITDADIDKMIESLRKQAATWETVERAAAQGDKVNIDFAGKKDGEPFEGGSAQGTDLELGSNSMIPGFEDAIVGMKAGEEKVVPLTFPEDYHADDLKGAAVEFTITLNSVAEQVLPELNAEFYAKFGSEDQDEQKFREQVAENMSRELENNINAKIKNQVFEGLMSVHDDIQVPAALISQQIESLRAQMLQQFGGAATKMDTASLLPDDMFQADAERQVKVGLVLNAIITEQSITADPDKVKAYVEQEASSYEKPQEFVDFIYGNQQQLQNIQSLIVEDTVIEKLLDGAKVTEKQASYEEAIAR